MVTDGDYGTVEDGTTKADPTRSLAYFSAFACGALSSNEQNCFKYQPKHSPLGYTDGRPRFEPGHGETTVYVISAVGTTKDWALLKTETVLSGSTALAAGLALAATISVAF